jgi:uncharacterized membrane protein SirB2
MPLIKSPIKLLTKRCIEYTSQWIGVKFQIIYFIVCMIFFQRNMQTPFREVGIFLTKFYPIVDFY